MACWHFRGCWCFCYRGCLSSVLVQPLVLVRLRSALEVLELVGHND